MCCFSVGRSLKQQERWGALDWFRANSKKTNSYFLVLICTLFVPYNFKLLILLV